MMNRVYRSIMMMRYLYTGIKQGFQIISKRFLSKSIGEEVEEGLIIMIEKLLDLLKKNDLENQIIKNKPDNKDLMQYISNRYSLLISYRKLKSKPGNMTPGADKETLNKLSLTDIDNYVEKLESGKFQFQDIKRVEIPNKPSRREGYNGKPRKLSIITPRDKIIQQSMLRVLNAIFELKFQENSHGFRTSRGCHTALEYIYSNFNGCKWYLELDIAKCFDSLNHDLLIKQIREHIKDESFMDLVSKSIKSYYIKDGNKIYSTVGAPQGSIISPIYSNIYMDLVDTYLNKYKKSKIKFVRYADDILIGVWGSKKDCIKLKEDLSIFLKSIHLEMSLNKTLITNAYTSKAKFLSTYISSRKGSKHPSLNAPLDLKKLIDKGYCDELGNSLPAYELMHLSAFQIISKYVAVCNSTLRYHSFADNFNQLKSKLIKVLKESCALTIAKKLSLTSIDEVYKIYGIRFKIYNKGKYTELFHESNFINRDDKFFEKTKAKLDQFKLAPLRKRGEKILSLENIEILKKTVSLFIDPCTICKSKVDPQIYHTRKLDRIKFLERNPNNVPDNIDQVIDKNKPQLYLYFITHTMNRKQLPLCKLCHEKIERDKQIYRSRSKSKSKNKPKTKPKKNE